MSEQSGNWPPLAVACAMERELVHLRALLAPAREERRAGRCFWRTTLDEYPVVLALCGIGMLSAAAVTEALIDHYGPVAVINFGCAGAHRADILPGDLVIGARVVAYDCVQVEPDGGERYKQMWYLREDAQYQAPYFAAAPHLLAAALRAADAWEGPFEAWPLAAGWPSSVSHRTPRVVVGTVASSDRWNRAPQRIQALAERHESTCEDMEAAAIALTCASHDVPFLAIKDISNNELLRTTDETFLLITEGQLGRRAAALALSTLRVLVEALQSSLHDGREPE